MEVVSAIGSIGGIIDIITRSMIKIHEIHKKIQGSNITLTAFTGELAATKVALRELKAALEDFTFTSDTVDEIEISLQCCNMLVFHIDEKLSGFSDRTSFGSGSLRRKIQFVLADEETVHCRACLSRTIAALNVVKDGVGRSAVSDEPRWHADEQVLFNQIKEDSSSLILLWDRDSAASRRTSSTWRSSIFEQPFSFDGELFQHRAYRDTFRALARRVGSNKFSKSLASEHPVQPRLQPAAFRHMRKFDVLVIGDQWNASRVFGYLGYSFPPNVFNFVIDARNMSNTTTRFFHADADDYIRSGNDHHLAGIFFAISMCDMELQEGSVRLGPALRDGLSVYRSICERGNFNTSVLLILDMEPFIQKHSSQWIIDKDKLQSSSIFGTVDHPLGPLAEQSGCAEAWVLPPPAPESEGANPPKSIILGALENASERSRLASIDSARSASNATTIRASPRQDG